MRSGDVKILFRLEKEDELWPPAEVESVWAEEVCEGIYRILNIPFFVKGLGFGDEVSAVEVDGELWYRKHIRWHGHRTVRVIIFDEQRVSSVIDELIRLGCEVERSHLARLIAVDVPPDVAPEAVVGWLTSQEAKGAIEFEEASVDW